MSRAGRGFFDDDDDDDLAPESFQSNRAAVDDESFFSPARAPPRHDHDRDSSVATGARTTARGGRISSVTGAAAGSSVRAGLDSSRGDSPSLDDILGEGGARDKSRNVQRLLRAYQNEVGAPELLKFPRQLVDKVVKSLARRVRPPLSPPSLASTPASRADALPHTQKDLVRIAQSTPGQDDAFYIAASVVATENMRAAHVLKMFTRQRIYKVRTLSQSRDESEQPSRS